MSANGPAYAAAALILYLDLPDTPLLPTARDHCLARQFHAKGIPVSLVESALLLATMRRRIRPAGLPPLPPIRSLAYFKPSSAGSGSSHYQKAISTTCGSNCSRPQAGTHRNKPARVRVIAQHCTIGATGFVSVYVKERR